MLFNFNYNDRFYRASDEEVDNSYGAEDFLQRIIFHNLYTDNANAYCPFDYDEGDLKCPLDGFLNITNAVRMTCDEMFYNCKWGNIEFRCCDYFIPIATSVGKCFMLNSINARLVYVVDFLYCVLQFYQSQANR